MIRLDDPSPESTKNSSKIVPSVPSNARRQRCQCLADFSSLSIQHLNTSLYVIQARDERWAQITDSSESSQPWALTMILAKERLALPTPLAMHQFVKIGPLEILVSASYSPVSHHQGRNPLNMVDTASVTPWAGLITYPPHKSKTSNIWNVFVAAAGRFRFCLPTFHVYGFGSCYSWEKVCLVKLQMFFWCVGGNGRWSWRAWASLVGFHLRSFRYL